MRRWFESALDSQLAALSTVLQKHRQPAVRHMTAQGWSVTSWETADWLNQSAAAAAAVMMASLLVPQQLLSRTMLVDSQALGLLTARRRACMRYWVDHTPAQRDAIRRYKECIMHGGVLSTAECLCTLLSTVNGMTMGGRRKKFRNVSGANSP